MSLIHDSFVDHEHGITSSFVAQGVHFSFIYLSQSSWWTEAVHLLLSPSLRSFDPSISLMFFSVYFCVEKLWMPNRSKSIFLLMHHHHHHHHTNQEGRTNSTTLQISSNLVWQTCFFARQTISSLYHTWNR